MPLLEEIKAKMLLDPKVEEFLSIANTPYKEVTAEQAASYHDLYCHIAMRYDLRYSEVSKLLGLDQNIGPRETPFSDYSKTQDVLRRIKIIWDREGIGSDEDESEPLYADLVHLLK